MREISIDSAAALALEFVRGSCSSSDIEITAKAAGVGMLFFQPRRRAFVWEELFCSSAGLASHSIGESRSTRVAIKFTQTVFEVEVLRQAKKLLGPENEAANPRFQQKIHKYKSALVAGLDAIVLSAFFLENLSKNLGDQKGSRVLQIVPIIASMQLAMRDGMNGLKIVLDDDSE